VSSGCSWSNSKYYVAVVFDFIWLFVHVKGLYHYKAPNLHHGILIAHFP